MNDPSNEVDPRVVRRKVWWRVIPLVFVIYIIAFMDRANLGFAKDQMCTSLGISDSAFGWGAGFFFSIGYLLLEIPGAILVERWSARKWFARILITWGICSMGMALVRLPWHLYTGRFLLGLAEAGFFPGVVVYFTHWFPRAERARALAGMIVGLPVSLALGARVSGWVLDVHWFGLAGWQWVFIVEGLPALLVGIALPFIMTDRPRHAKWLTSAERDWLERKLEQERREAAAIGSASLRVVIRRPAVWLLALGIFTANIGGFALLFWLPTAVRELLKRSNAVVSDGEAMNWMLPLYLLGLVGVWISGQLSDRTGKPKLYCMIGLALTGLLLGVSTMVGGSFNNFYAWLLATGLFMFWWPSPFWALLPRTLPPAVLPVAIGFVNMWANLSGAFGPTIVGEMKEAKLSLEACLRFPAICYLVACGLIAILHVPILKSPQPAIAPAPSE